MSKKTSVKAVNTERISPRIVVDYDENDHPIGLEITSPTQVTVTEINNVLQRLSLAPVSELELSPLKAS